jgi:protein gp37
MNRTSIEWTHRPETGGAAGGFTWNPIRARLKGARPDFLRRRNVEFERQKECDCPCGLCAKGHCGNPPCDQIRTVAGTFCTRISPGCTNCYASTINKRFGNGLEYTVPNLEKVECFISEKILAEPLQRKKPATIFVGDMFDLFHEAIPTAEISYVFATMHDATQHTFQVLTKRTARMRDFIAAWGGAEPNIWLGTSVESQKYADERIPLLLQTPAAVRFLSVEPMLEAVEIHLPDAECNHPSMDGIDQNRGQDKIWECNLCDGYVQHENDPNQPGFQCEKSGIDWVICGGESGPGARPFNLAWAESLQEQCKSAGVAFFMKQVGSVPVMEKNRWRHNHSPLAAPAAKDEFWLTIKNADKVPADVVPLKMKDSKGGDPSEWPEALRVRQFPAEKLVTA